MELYKQYRPTLFKHVVGQDGAVSVLKSLLEKGLPHALLFIGPSGCGKTTLARIVRRKIECADMDFVEVNAADFRGIDTIRDIRDRMGLMPVSGKSRVWLIDECHQLSKDAQNSLLKMLEDPPPHVYFMLCTTEPAKLINTVQTRCSTIKCERISDKYLDELLANVLQRVKRKLSDEVRERIIEAADGSGRRALVILEQVLDLKDDEDRLEAIGKSDVRRQGIEIARALFNPRSQWGDLAKLLKDVTDDVETIRHIVMGYGTTLMLTGNLNKAAEANLVLTEFLDPFYNSGRAGLATACYNVVLNRRRK